jgi:hypothetical protein
MRISKRFFLNILKDIVSSRLQKGTMHQNITHLAIMTYTEWSLHRKELI